MKKVAVLQSNYIPWKGYFDIIHDVDEFVFYDDIQYTKQDWRNRNRVHLADGEKWLTVPVGASINRMVCDVEIPNDRWQRKHYETLAQHFKKAPHFTQYEDFLAEVYLKTRWDNLSRLNQFVIERLSRDFLGIRTRFLDSRDYPVPGTKHEKLLNLLKALEARVYVSGPAARSYIIEKDYEDAGIEIVWKDYGGYPEYPQIYQPFEHAVTILDLLFHTGGEAPWYIWGWREQPTTARQKGNQ